MRDEKTRRAGADGAGAFAFVSKSHSSTEQSCSSGRSMSHWPSTRPRGSPFVSRTIAQSELLMSFLSTPAALAAWKALVSKAVPLASLSPNLIVISVRGSAA